MQQELSSGNPSVSGTANPPLHETAPRGVNSETSNPVTLKDDRKLVLLFALFCLVGVAVTVELTRIHVYVHTDPTYHSVCAMSEGVNCETVALSPYSVFIGLPVSLWGIAGYLLMGALSLTAISHKRFNATWPFGFLLVLTSFSLATSLVLAAISVTQIDSLCLFCMASYAINFVLFVINLVVLKRARRPVTSLLGDDFESLLLRPRLIAISCLLGLIPLTTTYRFIPVYWQSPGWADLPKLPTGTDENGHRWVGAVNPKLTIVEFSDYECPHCRSAHKSMRALAAKHADQVRLIHRHLPLDNACHVGLKRPFHTHACLFAEAAECAGLQGHFWEMNDALFSTQDTNKAANVDTVELAVRLGINSVEFKHCLANHSTMKRITADVEESMTLKLAGTPSFLVDGKLYPGRISEVELEQLLASVPRA
jgi:protein-disulfide isomerase/uncharacterized membrane protein